MFASHTPRADLSTTSQGNKRKCTAIFAGQEEAGVDEQQPELLSHIQRAVEQERHRIAEDLHDGAAQDMALALHKLEHIQHLLEQSRLYQAFQEVTHVARILENGLHNLRSSIDTLLPQQFTKQTAFTSLLTLIQEYQRDHPELQLDCQFEPHELLTHIPSGLEVPIFRFVQQALNNIWQHASATHVVISFVLLPDVLTIGVCDNGRGFSPQHEADKPLEGDKPPEWGQPLPYAANATPAQFGLRIMRERVEHVGGTWKIKSQPGGTSVYATFPLKELAYTL
jgi:two-component system sensor histidine kinase DegS